MVLALKIQIRFLLSSRKLGNLHPEKAIGF